MVKNVILVSGKLQSGKNTFVDLMMEEMRERNLKVDFDYFAKSVKDQCKDVFKMLIEYLNAISEQHNIPELKTEDFNWYEEKNKITRILLQTYGTDIFRDMIDANHWGKILKRRIMTERNEDFIFISDVRFKSEIFTICDMEPIKHDHRTLQPKYNVIKVRINRSNYERGNDPIFTHQSEIDLDDYESWDYLVENDGTLDDLKRNAKNIVDSILKQPSSKN